MIMTLEQCLLAARQMDEKYLAPICDKIERHEGGKHLYHLRWMVQEMHADMSNNKAMRWLGYIQGILVGVYGITLDDMKELSREAAQS
jgi:hypothetical protein